MDDHSSVSRYFVVLVPCIAALSLAVACSGSPSAPAGGEGDNAGADGGRKDNNPAKPGAGEPTPGPGGGAPRPEDGPRPPEQTDGGWPDPEMHPMSPDNKFYSGYIDATHKVQVPAAVIFAKDVKWTSSDDTKVLIEPLAVPPPKIEGFPGESYVTLTTKGAGTVKITAAFNGKSESRDLVITAYTLEQFEAGKKRYTTASSATDAGKQCSTCHFDTKTGGVDHSPWATTYYSDAQLLAIIQTAKYPDGSPHTLPTHKFDLTEVEKVGILAYVRALTLPPITDE